ncbi:hypothetical protein, variant 2 [Verruconis gallopava]|uniref:RNA-binding protein VTS1 n=1 Tax=Verruconis gallopava TaxID=253628 RepID=A0A0D2A7R2_9PEZI|nr:hypothetical protein, variant 2 [Verruconis gallopava]KIW02808.1 hypothetical protein, variant 2 [Verruconis gallopava]
MASLNTPGNRNSTPVESSSTLRPPSSRQIGAGHHLRASADMGAYSATPLSGRNIRPASEVLFNQAKAGQGSGAADEMDQATQQWLADIDQYEATLEEMATATLDQDFKDELSAIEQWFRVLSEAERTSALYALLQQTTQVQIRFFIQVLQEMAKNHPMSSILSPSAFGQKGSRNSLGIARPPPSPGAKRLSQLDPAVINSMFPDAAAAIAKQKERFTQETGMAPPSTRNSMIGDRSSLVAPSISAPEEKASQAPSSPFVTRTADAQQPPIARPKSSSGQQQQPMGQFTQPPPSAGLRSPRPLGLSSDTNIQSTTLEAPQTMAAGLPVLTPIGNWASALNTPMVGSFPNQQAQTDLANATAMKLAALSTVNNRIQFDDVRKYRRERSSEGKGNGAPASPGLPNANFLMTNELGQTQQLTPQQLAALQAQQMAAINGRRSRPNSPGVIMNPMPGLALPSLQQNGFLSAYDNNAALLAGMNAINLNQFGGVQGGEGYLSDHGDAQRGRSPRGRRGSSKPPEDPTDLQLLKDIPAWLRSLRLHKYTENLKDLKWQELIELDDEALEKRGVNALGARRKMLKVFEQVKESHPNGT